MKIPGKIEVSLALLLGCLGFATPASAYLDPSTGSMILSAVVGLFATIGLAVKTYWYRLKALFRGERREQSSSPPAEPADGDATPER